jgi:hypothetical protein
MDLAKFNGEIKGGESKGVGRMSWEGE